MNRKDIVIGIVVLLLVGGAAFYFNRNDENEDLKVPETLSIEDQIEDTFKIDIPDDVDKAELSGVGTGIVTRDEENGTTAYTVLVDLPETENTYQAWLLNDDGETKSLGTLRIAKGGYMTEYNSTTSMDGFNKVRVTEEMK